MIQKKHYLISVFLVALVSVWGTAFGVEGEYKTPSPADNQKRLNAGIAHLEEAIAAAKAGDAEAAGAHAKASKAELVEINSEVWAGKLEGASSKVRVGGAKAAKGDLENGLKLMEQALAKLKTL